MPDATPIVPTTQTMPATPATPTVPTVPATQSTPATPIMPTTESTPATPTMPATQSTPATPTMPATQSTPATPIWEVFLRSRNGLAHKHVGSLYAADAEMALQAARDVYTRRGEGLSIWVVPSAAIVASDPADRDSLFEPAADKIYRHPTFYEVPEEIGHM